jgi:glycosyltransferase involved in cell wall biosynthesis
VLTNPGSVARAIRTEGTLVHHVGMRSNTDLAALPRLVRLMRAGRFDLVHTHLYRACVYGRVAARLAGVPAVVATEHSLGARQIEGRPISPGVRRLYLATERLGDATVAVSSAVARRLVALGVPGTRIRTIPNAIEIGRYRFDPWRRASLRAGLGIPPERFVVGAVGRLVPGKRLELVLHAARAHPDVTVLMVGDGPRRPALTELARELAVPVVFTGERSDVPDLLSTMDILVAPSADETFGLSVVEALAAGLPVVYASCPALDELARPVPGAVRVNGDPEAVRGAVAGAVRAGPRRLPPPPALARFDAAGVAAQTNALYERLTAGPGAKHRRGN